MMKQLTYRLKRFLLKFILYGLPFSLLMWVMNLDNYSIGSFLFSFIFYGGIMAVFMGAMEKYNLQKSGIKLDANTMNEHQERKLPTLLNEREFYDLWIKSEVYTATQNDDGSLDIKRRYYTSEFKETIIVSYQSDPSPMMIFRSKPKRWFGNNIILIHKTIESVENYAKKNMNREASI